MLYNIRRTQAVLWGPTRYGGSAMITTQPCKLCGSTNVGNFPAEIAIHFHGRGNLSKPHVFVFPVLLVCFDCGMAQLAVPEAALRQLAEDRDAGAGRINDTERKRGAS